ncbi:MAG TPA: exopolysaccharide biosynthesis polyprenyl glycosylphosphotransferase [Acetobacteraceae bacterium]|jgi:exopolysaccharide biosynthesis polyprenyl glycosylphosphotransferase|nr:exopolysaccharide biosynthesis polyprenyl glycosylphosphotransferase [Acetobacteraceae bacterium]
MTRVLGRFVSLEMALLGLCELALSFLVVYAMLNAPGVVPVLIGHASLASPFTVANDTAGLAALLSCTVVLTGAAIGLYRPEVCIERRRLLINTAVAGLLAFPAVVVVSGSFNVGLSRYAILWLTKVMFAWLACIVTSRLIFNRVMRERWFVRRILVLGSGPHLGRIRRLTNSGRGRLFEPVFVDGSLLGEPPTPVTLRRRRIWGIVIAGQSEADNGAAIPVRRLLDCKLRGVPIFDEAGFSEQQLGRIDLDSVHIDWLLFADGFASGRIASTTRRGVDLLVSLALLLLTLPIILLTAALIRLESAGPVLYRQTRVGLHGEPFTLLKFRSMTIDAEEAGQPRWATQQDPRMTRIGSFIRPMRIDELPQLLNVLRGEMSLVGPRPERPMFVEELAKVIPFYTERSYVKPGITGWAQVNLPYGASIEDARQKLSYDLYYVKNRSLLLDQFILMATIRVILFREGAR